MCTCVCVLRYTSYNLPIPKKKISYYRKFVYGYVCMCVYHKKSITCGLATGWRLFIGVVFMALYLQEPVYFHLFFFSIPINFNNQRVRFFPISHNIRILNMYICSYYNHTFIQRNLFGSMCACICMSETPKKKCRLFFFFFFFYVVL